MPVEFVVQTADLRQATNQLKANRGEYSDTDFVDIVVSQSVAIFRAVGTEAEAAVEGKAPGSVRVPLRIVDKIGKVLTTWKTKELTFHCEPGVIKVDTFSLKHADIELNRTPEPRLDLPVNLSLLDTLALTKIFTPREIADEGMRERVERAEYSRRAAIADALAALKALEIEERQLIHLVDSHVQVAAERLRKALPAA